MMPGITPEFAREGDASRIVREFEQLSIALENGIDRLRREPGSERTVVPIERALEKTRTGAQLARKLANKLRHGD